VCLVKGFGFFKDDGQQFVNDMAAEGLMMR
jgi:hypothetical protein